MAVELRAGVGNGRPNLRQDVALVQFLLSGTGADVRLDGVFGGGTAAALSAFQLSRLGFTDGFADPGDITFKLLRGDLDDGSSAVVRASILSLLGEMAIGTSAIEEAPTSDGRGLASTWPHGDGIARIYSHPVWGTWEVRGLILSRYFELGDEAGEFGLPISGEREHGAPGGRVSFFEHGRIEFDPAAGVTETLLLRE